MTTYNQYKTILDPVILVPASQAYLSLKYRTYLINRFYTIVTPEIYKPTLTSVFSTYLYWKTYLIFKFAEFTKPIFRM